MRPEHEAGRADALEVQVAREVVAARPQRLERRRQPRLELDEGCRPAARCPCAPTPARAPAARRAAAPVMRWTRTTMRSERSRSSRTSTKPATSTFQAAACSTGCAIMARLAVAVRKPAAAAAIASASGKAIGPVAGQERTPTTAATNSAAAAHSCGLPVGGEVEDDPEAEGDGEPGHEPARARRRPAPRRAAARRSGAQTPARPSGHAQPACRPAACRPPRRFPSARDTLIDHRADSPERPRACYIGRGLVHRCVPRCKACSGRFGAVKFTGAPWGVRAPWRRKPWPRCRAARRCG